MNTFFGNIQGLRGIAVLFVILFHLQGIERKYSTDWALPDLLQLGAIGVDVFFLISGFIMMTVTRPLLPGKRSAFDFILHRCIRIYPLYWLVSALILAGILLKPDAVKNIPSSDFYLLQSFLLLPQTDLPLLSLGWTLIHEIYFYCVFGILLLLPAKTRIPALALWSALSIALWQILQPEQTQPWLYVLCNPLTLEFTTGCFIAALLQRKQAIHPLLILFAGIAATLVSWYFWASGSYREFPVGSDRVIYFLVPCALILAGSVAMDYQGISFHRWLKKTGDASYSLYLTHILIMSVGGRLWQLFRDQSSLADNMMWLSALFAVTLTGGMLCHQWIEKPLIRYLRQLVKIV
jgi:exopolysaccharide production protein ExoZ